MNQYMTSHAVMYTSMFISRFLDDTDDNNCPLSGPCMLIFLDIVLLHFSLLTTHWGGGHPRIWIQVSASQTHLSLPSRATRFVPLALVTHNRSTNVRGEVAS